MPPKLPTSALTLAALACLGGCPPVHTLRVATYEVEGEQTGEALDVIVEAVPDVDFSTLRSFAFLPRTDPNMRQSEGPENAEALIRAELTAHGLEEAPTDQADVFVYFSLAQRDPDALVTSNVFEPPEDPHPGRFAATHGVVDLVHPITRRTLWHSYTRLRGDDPETFEARAADIVAALLGGYPPVD